jgi:hypothetical protein
VLDRARVFYLGVHTRVSRKYLIKKNCALRVMNTWWEKGEVSNAIEWTQEIFEVG